MNPIKSITKDLLGNTRETYVHPDPEYKECIQRMQYYPSGLPWAAAMVPAEQPWKYNSKEFVEMHGLDEYDSKARWYYPAICRTTTMDPLAEKYYSISPYAWCGNNPINKIDVNGDSILLMDDWISTYISINNMLPNNVYVDIENNYIQLNRNSNLTTSNNLFYEDLITAAQSSKTIELRKSNYNVYLKDGIMHSDEFMKPYDYSIDMETDFIRDHLHSLGVPQGRTIHGNLGQSLFPNENLLSGKSSTNSNIQITINAKGTYNHQYVGLAHELGHIILYLQGSAFGHGQIGVDAAITLRENQLKDKLGYDY
jgi:RHS repeat-associated protein